MRQNYLISLNAVFCLLGKNCKGTSQATENVFQFLCAVGMAVLTTTIGRDMFHVCNVGSFAKGDRVNNDSRFSTFGRDLKRRFAAIVYSVCQQNDKLLSLWVSIADHVVSGFCEASCDIGSAIKSSSSISVHYCPDLCALVIETVDGKLFRGSQVYESADGITLQQINGTTVRINQQDIEARVLSAKSLMPEGLLKDSSDQDWSDLYKYLMAK